LSGGRAPPPGSARSDARLSRGPHAHGRASRVPWPIPCGLSLLPGGHPVCSLLRSRPGQSKTVLRAVRTRLSQQSHQSQCMTTHRMTTGRNSAMTLGDLLIAEVLACSLSMLLGYVIDLVRRRAASDDYGHDTLFGNGYRRAGQTWTGP